MKVIIEFNLPEEANDFKMAIWGRDYWSNLHDIAQELRNQIKYGHEFKDVDEALEWVRSLVDYSRLDEIE